jgi:4'-phosphopantetheinyl transferase
MGSPQLRLAPNEVHLWLAWPDQILSPELLGRYEQLLSPFEADRHRRFVRESDRHLYLVSHALVRSTLARYAEIRPSEWTFDANAYERPEVRAGLCTVPLRFNLSHSRDVAVCAVALERDIGVDVERIDRGGQTVSLADRFFSPAEVTALHQVAPAEQVERFFAYWTLKEAYIKARGMGLSLPLEQFSFDLSDPEEPRISFDPQLADHPAHWCFKTLQPSVHHRLALAVRVQPGQKVALRVRATVPLED